MRFLLILGALLFGPGAVLAAGRTKTAGELPPIGERKYVVDPENPYATGEIRGLKQGAGKTYLKDPIQSAPGIVFKSLEISKKRRAEAKKAKLKTVKAVELSFRPLPVSGRLTKPRVDFTRDLLEVPRADEPVTASFYDRIFEPMGDPSF